MLSLPKDGKWKPSNLRRHQRVQHPPGGGGGGENRVYACRWRGCKSRFTRSDNLKCHAREKRQFERAWEESLDFASAREKR